LYGYAFVVITVEPLQVVVGQNALYVRPPSSSKDATIFRFNEDEVHKDFLTDGHKKFYGAWKRGQDEEYDGFVEAVVQEQALIDQIQTEIGTLKDEKEIASWWINRVEQSERARVPDVVLPDTPVSPEATPAVHIQPGADGAYADLAMYIPRVQPDVASRRGRPFRFPDDQRSTGTAASSNDRIQRGEAAAPPSTSPHVAVKEEEESELPHLTDYDIAKAMEAAEALAASGCTITVDESPPAKARRTAEAVTAMDVPDVEADQEEDKEEENPERIEVDDVEVASVPCDLDNSDAEPVEEILSDEDDPPMDLESELAAMMDAANGSAGV